MDRKKLSHKSGTTWWSSLDGQFLFLEEQSLKLHIRPNFYLSCIQVTRDGWYRSDKSSSDTRAADYENDKEKHQGIQALERMPGELNLRATVVIPFRSSHEGSNSQACDDRAKPPHLPGPRWRLLSLPLSLVFFPHPLFSRSPLWGGYSCPASTTVDRRNFCAHQTACHDVIHAATRSEAEQMVWSVAAPLSSPDKRGQATSEPSSFKKHLKALYHPSNWIPLDPLKQDL